MHEKAARDTGACDRYMGSMLERGSGAAIRGRFSLKSYKVGVDLLPQPILALCALGAEGGVTVSSPKGPRCG